MEYNNDATHREDIYLDTNMDSNLDTVSKDSVSESSYYDSERESMSEYETIPKPTQETLDANTIVIEEEDNLVQYTEKQFHNRSQQAIDIEAFKQEFLNSMDNDLQDCYIRSNSPISMSNHGSRSGSVNGQGSRDGSFYEGNEHSALDRYRNLSFQQVQQTIDKYYEEDHSNKYSSEIDILTTYIKGQKHLFIQSKYLTQWKLNCLMFPCIFIAAAITIIAPFIECHHWSVGFTSGLNACIALCLSLINYLKLESSTEIYLFMANHYDKIETILNMTNSKLVILDNDEEKKSLVLRKINEIESKITELKESYTILIPEEIKKRYPIICQINIFLFIKKLEMRKKNLIIKFRDVKNEIRYILHRWKTRGDLDEIETSKEKHRLSYLYTVKGNLKNEILKYRCAYGKMEEAFTAEIRGGGTVGLLRSPFNSLALLFTREKKQPVPAIDEDMRFILD